MRICVIGGGAAGLSIAYYLGQQGYSNVTLLEKSDRLGGKCRTLWLDGMPYDMGAVEVTGDYPLVNGLIEKFGLATTNVPDIKVFDYATGESHAFPHSLYTDLELVELLVQLARFELAIADPLVAEYLNKAGLSAMPASLKGRSFEVWLEAIGAPLVGRLFWMPITCYGYGYLDQIPAAYALKFATVTQLALALRRFNLAALVPQNLRSAIFKALGTAFVNRLERGMEYLMDAIAAALVHECAQPAPILNVGIQAVHRTNAGVTVEYRIANDAFLHVERFDRLVVAIPQTRANLGFMDLTPEEVALFDQVFTNNYYTTLQRTTGLPYQLSAKLLDSATNTKGPPPAPHVLQFARNWPGQDGSVFYTYADARAPLPLSGPNAPNVEALVGETIASIDGAAGQHIVQSFAWQYFPQVSQGSLDTNFYDRLESIQGANNTVYVGGLMNFELVEKVIEYSRYRASIWF